MAAKILVVVIIAEGVCWKTSRRRKTVAVVVGGELTRILRSGVDVVVMHEAGSTIGL